MADINLEISCQQVKLLLESDKSVLLVDCREPEEQALVSLNDALLVPMRQIVQRIDELANRAEERLIVYCHHGLRSAQVAAWLRENGISHAQSMAGGIDQWAQVISPGMVRY